MVELSETSHAVVDRLFPAGDCELVRSLLREECGDNLPLVHGTRPEDFDRFRLAALKLSEGDLAKLDYAVKVAKVDWRDLLVAAGFANSPTEHIRWAEALLRERV
jgi:hypothetical protein